MGSQFYILDLIFSQNDKLSAGGQYIDDSVRCPSCGIFVDNNKNHHETNIKLNHVGRLGFSPYLWNSHSLPILRKDLIDIWCNEGVSGYTTEQVNIVGWFENAKKFLPDNIPEYQRIIPTSLIKLIEPGPVNDPCPVCGFVEYSFPKVDTHLQNGMQVDVGSWNGLDINGLNGYRFIFCTKKVVLATLQAGFGKFVAFIETEKWSKWEEFDVQTWEPAKYEKYVSTFLIRKIKDLST